MELINIVIITTLYFYNVLLIYILGKVVDFKINKKIAIIVIPLIMAIIFSFLEVFAFLSPIEVIANFLGYMIIFKIIFDETIGSIYILSIYQIFQVTIIKDIIIKIIILIFGESIYQTIQDYHIYFFIGIFSRFIMLGVIMVFWRIDYINTFKKFLVYKKKLKMSILTITSLTIIALSSNYNDYLHNISDVHGALINKILIYFCFYFAIGMGFKSINWIEEEEDGYKKTLINLENSYKMNENTNEYRKLIRMYNHDFKNILFTVKDSIDMGNIEKAKEIISGLDNQIKTIIKANEKFSNNCIINAILNRLHEECKSKDIFLKAECYIPDKVNISDLELIKIFNNLSSNALQACINQEKYNNKWIIFKSYVKDGKLIIYQSNSFNGQVNIINNRFITTKEDKENHGIGIESIKYIVSQLKGVYLIKADKEKREFKFLIKIPLDT